MIDNDLVYTISMLDKSNVKMLINHCDQKIDRYFAKLDKKIERLVKAEVKKATRKKK